VMMMAITPSLNASNRPLLIHGSHVRKWVNGVTGRELSATLRSERSQVFQFAV
jgi:hypothetical protein